MYNRQSKSGYRQSKVRQKSMNPKGFRVGGEHGTFPATLVVPFEVEELGNEHILEEASKVLQCEPTLDAIKKAIIKSGVQTRKHFGYATTELMHENIMAETWKQANAPAPYQQLPCQLTLK